MKSNATLRAAARTPLRRLRLATGVALAVLSVVGPAAALANGTVDYFPADPYSPPSMSFTADPADANNLTVSVSGVNHDVTITDANNPINLPPTPTDCRQPPADPNTVTCPGPGILLSVQLGDGGSDITIRDALDEQPTINGGLGDDTMIGGPGPETISGGAGNDIIRGNGGDDVLSGADAFGGDNAVDDIDGGPGADSFALLADDGGDILRGGPGSDHLRALLGTVGGPGATWTLDDGLANDGSQEANVTEIEDIETGEGADVVRGTNGSNVIITNDSNDFVDGLAGSDVISTGTQDDTVEARDGYRDRINCGDGDDTAMVDQLDEVSGCEHVTVTFVQPAGTTPLPTPAPAATPPASAPAGPAPPIVTPPALDRTPPVCITRVRRRISRPSRSILVREACDEPSAFRVTLTTRVQGRPVIASVGDVVLARRLLSRRGTSRRVRITIPRRLRPALGLRAKLKLRVQATDASGNRRVTFQTIMYRRR